MRAAGAVAPCPERTPDAASEYCGDCYQISGQPEAAARAIRPEEDSNAERDRERESQDRRPGARGFALSLYAFDLRRSCVGPLREELRIGDGFDLLVDLRQLLVPIPIRHVLSLVSA